MLEQNSDVERKNSHLFAITRALLCTSKKYFGLMFFRSWHILWIVCHLGLTIASSHPLKVFGYIRYEHIQKSSRFKLDPKALKCIFFVYVPS